MEKIFEASYKEIAKKYGDKYSENTLFKTDTETVVECNGFIIKNINEIALVTDIGFVILQMIRGTDIVASHMLPISNILKIQKEDMGAYIKLRVTSGKAK